MSISFKPGKRLQLATSAVSHPVHSSLSKEERFLQNYPITSSVSRMADSHSHLRLVALAYQSGQPRREVEHIIASDLQSAFYYAEYVLCSPFYLNGNLVIANGKEGRISLVASRIGADVWSAYLRDTPSEKVFSYPEEVVRCISEEIDPTEDCAFLESVCKQYARGMFSLKQSPELKAYLQAFHQNLHNFDNRSFTQFASSEHLAESVRPFVRVISKEEYPVESDGEGESEPESPRQWPDDLSKIKSDPRLAAIYAREVLNKPWPEVEPVILRDSWASLHYSTQVLKKRWTEAEPVILKEPYSAYMYARKFFVGRWPQAEPTIMKASRAACDYARYVIKGRWPEAEDVIKRSPYWASEYAVEALKDRWPDAEAIIAKDAHGAFEYVKKILKERWPLAEPYIMKDGYWASQYAIEILNTRWPDAESSISKNAHAAYHYGEAFFQGRWTPGEPAIAQDDHWGYKYAKKFFPEGWQLAEPAILKNAWSSQLYAVNILKKRWSPAEVRIVRDPWAATRYAEAFMPGTGWKEAEPQILKNASACYEYAVKVLKKRWPVAEEILKKNKHFWGMYSSKFLGDKP